MRMRDGRSRWAAGRRKVAEAAAATRRARNGREISDVEDDIDPAVLAEVVLGGDEAADDDPGDDVADDVVGFPESEPDPDVVEPAPVGGLRAPAVPPAGGEPTVLERLRSAGINEATARRHLVQGWVRVDGVVVTDPDLAAGRPARLVIQPPLSIGLHAP